MKRLWTIHICTLMALMLVFSMAYAESDEPWEMALAAVEQATGCTSEQLTTGQIVHEESQWIFSVELRDHAEDEDGLLIGVMDESGTLISLSGPEKVSLERQLERDLKACFNQEDCYLRLAEAHAKWQLKLAQAGERQISEIFPSYLAVVRLSLSVPGEDALPYEETKTAAMQGLAAAMGWPEDYPGLFRVWCSAYHLLDGEPVWFFGLEWHSYMEEAYEEDEAMDQYLADLSSAFSQIGQEIPIEIGVLVNATTGELAEKPMLDYVPMKYHYLDFLIRTEEAVDSVQGKP